jgi:hypothetical protein
VSASDQRFSDWHNLKIAKSTIIGCAYCQAMCGKPFCAIQDEGGTLAAFFSLAIIPPFGSRPALAPNRAGRLFLFMAHFIHCSKNNEILFPYWN